MGILKVLRSEFRKFMILENLNFHPYGPDPATSVCGPLTDTGWSDRHNTKAYTHTIKLAIVIKSYLYNKIENCYKSMYIIKGLLDLDVQDIFCVDSLFGWT